MKKIWIGIAVALLVVAVGGGAFFGGMSYGKSQARQNLTSLMQGRFGARGGQFPSTGVLPQGTPEGTTSFGGGIRGTIQAIEGNTLVINADEGIVKVQTTDTTLIEKNMPVSVGDLKVGETVVVSGPQNEDGSITARSVMSMRAFQPNQPSGGGE
jgi:hypothetical protein